MPVTPQLITDVTIKSGSVRTVFGGGENGRVAAVYSKRLGGVVGDSISKGTIHGGFSAPETAKVPMCSGTIE